MSDYLKAQYLNSKNYKVLVSVSLMSVLLSFPLLLVSLSLPLIGFCSSQDLIQGKGLEQRPLHYLHSMEINGAILCFNGSLRKRKVVFFYFTFNPNWIQFAFTVEAGT